MENDGHQYNPDVDLARLNEVWYEVFGHTYEQCLALSEIEGPVGEPHRAHIEFITKQHEE